MLADLLNPPETPEDWERWGNSHSINHAAIIEAIQQQYGITLAQRQLYPISSERFPDWLERNQHAHYDVNQLLALTSIDLQNVDISNRQQLVAWIQVHHQAHYDICARLGISV